MYVGKHVRETPHKGWRKEWLNLTHSDITVDFYLPYSRLSSSLFFISHMAPFSWPYNVFFTFHGYSWKTQTLKEIPPEKPSRRWLCIAGVASLHVPRNRGNGPDNPQQIVTTRLLYCSQDRVAQLSRLQRIWPRSCWNYNTRITVTRFERRGGIAC
jgi:hypothetical protein